MNLTRSKSVYSDVKRHWMESSRLLNEPQSIIFLTPNKSSSSRLPYERSGNSFVAIIIWTTATHFAEALHELCTHGKYFGLDWLTDVSLASCLDPKTMQSVIKHNTKSSVFVGSSEQTINIQHFICYRLMWVRMCALFPHTATGVQHSTKDFFSITLTN